MSDLIYTIGFKGDFYFYSPKKGISSTYWEKGKKDLGTVTDIEHPLCVALGPSLDWFFGYRAKDGQLKLIRRREKGPDSKRGSFYRWSAGQASYDKLEVWLRFCAVSLGDMAQTRVSLGPRGSYFATSPAGSVISNDLPSSFEHLINPQQSGRIPTWVALGVNDAWFALWPNSSCSCHLRDEYPDLETLLKKHGKAGVKSIALSPSQSNQFAVTFHNTQSFIRAPVSEANLQQLNGIAAHETTKGRGPMEVTVCGLYITSAPVEMPQPILNLQRLTFPGSPIDKVGKQSEAGANGMTNGANIASWLANFPSCVVM